MSDGLVAPRTDLATLVAALTAASVASRPATDSDAIDGLRPFVVASPADEAGLASTIVVAGQIGAALVPRGGGTRLHLGNPTSRVDLVLDATALSGIVEHEPADLTVTVRAGCRLADLQSALMLHGQYLPVDPPRPGLATIGGIVASASTGPLCQRYGTVRDLLIGVRVVNASGTVTHAGGKVVKNVAGYDLCKLYIGSLGTLGVITEATFKLAPLPEKLQTVLAWFASAETALEAVRRLVRTGVRPLAADVLGASSARHCGLIPPSVGAAALVLLGGHPATVRREVHDVTALFASFTPDLIADYDHQADLWSAVRTLPDDPRDSHLLLRASVPLAALPAAWKLLGDATGGDSVAKLWARAGFGVLYASAQASADAGTVANTIATTRRQIVGLGGSLTVEVCPTRIKSLVDAWGQPEAVTAMMHAIKERLDPHGMLSPGRFAGI